MYRKHSLVEMVVIASGSGGKCLADEYLGVDKKILWECKEGHQWQSRPAHVLAGHWCPVCGHQRAAKKRIKYLINDMSRIASKRNGKCLSAKYLGYDKKLRWQCQDGHSWEAIPDNIIHGKWCPKCAKRKNFTEEKCRHIVEGLTGLSFPSNRTTLGGYELDMYNSDRKLGIEYNGEQHYRFVKGFHKTENGIRVRARASVVGSAREYQIRQVVPEM